ncbi:MAG: hypothetical protein A3J38_02840 [Gammaproteobacteria bacterium RIFCSPHIGHO2_12_FULL_45_9]|nr:MAG: hypothetical protein A3J38_02840 [Gammaproteobacteria bacterium RIFCSPHIGHO2_12_FULL_45_9]
MPLIGMAIDLVAPSLPAIATGLQVSHYTAKNVISIYLLGYAFGNFFTGFLTDAFGRQKLIRFSLLGFALASLIPLFWNDITALLLSRLLQGLTLGAVSVLLRAIFADILPPEKLVRLGTLIGAMWGLGPIIGPVMGGYLQVYFGWKAGFCFFAVIAFIAWIATTLVVPETHFNRHPLRFNTIRQHLTEVFTHRTFLSIIILMGLSYSLLIVFNTSGPFLIQSKLHYSPIFFGHLALWLGVVFLASTFACRYALKYYSIEYLLARFITILCILAGLGVILSYIVHAPLVLVTGISALVFFACGFIFPMTMGKGLSIFRHIAGTATAAMYLVNILITSLTAFIASLISIQSALSLMWLYFCLLLASVCVYWGMMRQKSM